MKTNEKKKAYRKHVRAQLQAGLANDANGNWVSNSQLNSKVEQRAKSISAKANP